MDLRISPRSAPRSAIGGEIAIKRAGIEDLAPGLGVVLLGCLQVGQELLGRVAVEIIGRDELGFGAQTADPLAQLQFGLLQGLALGARQVQARINLGELELVEKGAAASAADGLEGPLDVTVAQTQIDQTLEARRELGEVDGALLSVAVGQDTRVFDHLESFFEQTAGLALLAAPILDACQAPKRDEVRGGERTGHALLKVAGLGIELFSLGQAPLKLGGQREVIERPRQQECVLVLFLHHPDLAPGVLGGGVILFRQMVQALAV